MKFFLDNNLPRRVAVALAALYGPEGQEIVHLNLPEPAHAEDAIHHFATCVVDGKKPAVTIEESLRLQKVLDGMYASASSGKEVRMT